MMPLPAKHARRFLALATAALGAAACRDQAPISHAPVQLVVVSGANQSGDLSTALAQPLVIEALDGAKKPVAGVPIAWAVSSGSGGSLSAQTSTTGADGTASVTWTLASTPGVQVVTATSTQITGVSVSFVANNGAMITGAVTAAGMNPFAANLSRTLRQPLRLNAVAPRTVSRHPSPTSIVVGFKSTTLAVAAAGASAYRSLSVARDARTRMQARVASFQATMPVSRAEFSPAILAARMHVDDTTQLSSIMATLRNNPDLAYVERDQVVSIRDGAPQPVSTKFIPQFAAAAPTASFTPASVVGKLPNDPGFWEQSWTANMVDLPRAWAITTGSSNVIVASVDMGIRFDHPETAANLTTDGYDFVSQVGFGDTELLCDGGSFTTIDGDGDGPDADPTDPDDLVWDPFDGCWAHNQLGDHGLWTAGIIGAAGNDGRGLAGVNWNVKIRPIRVLGITGDGTDFDIAQGILYAAGLPAAGAGGAMVQAPSAAPIISMSLGGPDPSDVMSSAVAAAVGAGSLVVASAGNDGLDFPAYPAAYPGVMAVAAVGMDGALATYSNAGTFLSVAAPGGDFRLDDNGGGGVLGPGWDFEAKAPTYLFGYGTSASAPFVSGIAALLLAQTPGLTAAQLRSRIEQNATRPAGQTRNDTFGWGIVDAYNALTQQNGPVRRTYVRLVDAVAGSTVRTLPVNSDGTFALTRLANGAYFLQAGDDEAGDSTIGVPGRRFGWAGGFGKPTIFNVNSNSQTAEIALGIPAEVEPNDDVAHANVLSVGSWVVGSITPPDVQDVYSVDIPVAGQYTFETSGLVGSCGMGIELDTFISVVSSTGTAVGSNDDFTSSTGRFCSHVQATLAPGIYYVTVTGSDANGLADHGRYRLEVRAGP